MTRSTFSSRKVGLPASKSNNEAHTNPRREGQLGLCQPELLASGAQCIAELLR
jgi:hypothetical protein